MEVLGSPHCEVWIRLKGGRLHVWRIETFSLLGECLGSVLEVGPATARKENLLFGRVKVAGNLLQDLPQRLHLWLDDLCMPIDGELEREEKKGVLNVGDYEDSRTFMDSRVIGAKHTELTVAVVPPLQGWRKRMMAS